MNEVPIFYSSDFNYVRIIWIIRVAIRYTEITVQLLMLVFYWYVEYWIRNNIFDIWKISKLNNFIFSFCCSYMFMYVSCIIIYPMFYFVIKMQSAYLIQLKKYSFRFYCVCVRDRKNNTDMFLYTQWTQCIIIYS